MAVEPKAAKKATNTKPPYTNSVREGTNTTLSRNQGSPQPGAPKSHSVSRTGKKTHKCHVANGKVTQNIVKQSVKLSYGEKVPDASLLRLSGSSQIPLNVLFQASSSLEAAKRSCGASCFQN